MCLLHHQLYLAVAVGGDGAVGVDAARGGDDELVGGEAFGVE